jgi:hypothetical protein
MSKMQKYKLWFYIVFAAMLFSYVIAVEIAFFDIIKHKPTLQILLLTDLFLFFALYITNIVMIVRHGVFFETGVFEEKAYTISPAKNMGEAYCFTSLGITVAAIIFSWLLHAALSPIIGIYSDAALFHIFLITLLYPFIFVFYLSSFRIASIFHKKHTNIK